MHTVKWFKALLSNTSNSIQYLLSRKPSTPLESELFCLWSWWMKALSRSLSIDIEQYAELVLLLTRLLYFVITSLINPFYCDMLFSVCLYKPQINIIIISIISLQLNGFVYSKWLNSSIWPIDRTLTGTTTSAQNEPGSNGNEKELHIL